MRRCKQRTYKYLSTPHDTANSKSSDLAGPHTPWQNVSARDSWMNITFSGRDTPACRAASDAFDNGVTLSLVSQPVLNVCVNLNNTFTNPKRTYIAASPSPPRDTVVNSGMNYTVLGKNAAE